MQNLRYFLTVIAGAFSAVALAVIFPSLVPAPTEVLGAPETQATFQKNLIPMTDSTYTLGTTTKTWLNLYTDEVCLAGDCKTAWPVGVAGSFASSSPWTNGYLAYVVDNNTFSSVATGTLTTTATGLSLSATRGLVGGASILSLTTGYNIPLTASTTEWATAYGWGNHAVAGYDQVTTAGDGLTRTLNDFDCDTASGSVFGCLASADWTTFNNKQATISVTHPILLSGATLSLAFSTTTANSWSQLQTFTYASTTGISGTNLTFTNATSTASFFSALGTFTNSVINTLLTAVSGVFTSSLQIPNSSDPTVDASGEIAVNTSTSSLRFHDNTAERQIKSEWSWGATLASSSLAYDGAFDSGGTTTIQKVGFKYGVTHTEYYCRTNVGNVTIVVGDGTASSSPIRCSATGTADSTASNGSFTAREMIYISVGSSDNNSSLTDIYFDATARWTTD